MAWDAPGRRPSAWLRNRKLPPAPFQPLSSFHSAVSRFPHAPSESRARPRHLGHVMSARSVDAEITMPDQSTADFSYRHRTVAGNLVSVGIITYMKPGPTRAMFTSRPLT